MQKKGVSAKENPLLSEALDLNDISAADVSPNLKKTIAMLFEAVHSCLV